MLFLLAPGGGTRFFFCEGGHISHLFDLESGFQFPEKEEEKHLFDVDSAII